jgi:hypothetical protein
LADFKAYVICWNPIDFPGKFALRRHTLDVTGRLVADEFPIAVCDDLDSVRQRIPPGLVMMPLEEFDDPVIIEWYF